MKGKVRLFYLLSTILCVICFAGCMPVPRGEQPPEEFRLGEAVVIEGVDVSRMTISEARDVVEAAAKKRIENMTLRFMLKDLPEAEAMEKTGDTLPIVPDVEGALQEASYLTQYKPVGEEERVIPVIYRLEDTGGHKLATAIQEFFYVPATNATASYSRDVEGLFAYTQGEPGRQVEEETIFAYLQDAAEQAKNATIQLPWQEISPAYTVEDAMADHQLVATFTTSYAKSPHNASGRVFNIQKAAGLIDGVTLQPGEEFDMNATLGPRNGETGWRTAAGIRDGKYEQEYGGGVCQVSTTLFNAVMMADLEITDRRPHSWPLSYVPIGRDATISTGGPNFKFVNSSESEVVIVAQTTKDKKVTVSIYGRPLADGVSIQISSKQTGTLSSPGTERLLDASLPYNTTVEDRKERRGKTSVTYKEYYDADGELIRKETAYEDKYRSIRGRVYVSSDLY